MASSTSAQTDDRGRSAFSPWEMPLSGWREALLRTWKESTKDNIGLVAAGVAYYSFLALVPLLGATVLSYGLIASPRAVLAHMSDLTHILPADIARLVGDQLMNVVQSSKSRKGIGVLVALAVALFGARNAAGSIIIALNIAYEEEEKRGFLRVTLLAIGITIAAVVLALLGVAAIGLIQFVGRLFPNAPAVAVITKIATPLFLAVGAALAAAALYRYGPSRDRARWTWLTPGSLFAAVAWLLITALFGLYLTRFAHYDATYGSIAGVVALLTWVFLSSYVFLFGAELNSELEHQTARDTTKGEERPLGERGAWSADHVADGADDEGKEAEEGKPSPMSSDPTKPAPPTRAVATQRAVGDHAYLASRLTSRAAKLAGLPKIGAISSVMATAGLSLLRRRGRAGAGAALLGVAAGLALLRRRDPED